MPRTLTLAILWLTTASLPVAGLPLFDCLCPNGRHKPLCLSLASGGCCCGGHCCPKVGDCCGKAGGATEGREVHSGCQKTPLAAGFIVAPPKADVAPAIADCGTVYSQPSLAPTAVPFPPSTTADRPPPDLVVMLLRLTM